MKRKFKFWQVPKLTGNFFRLSTLCLAVGLIASFPFHPVLAGSSHDDRSDDDASGIAPIQSHPHGKTYSEWAATWWQWALQNPASSNPLLDKGACSNGQSGKVWFIGGSFSGDGSPVVRTCTIPPGTALFFPLVSFYYGAFLNDPPEQRTETFLRSQVDDCESPTLLKAQIDGESVRNPAQYLERSPLFDVQLSLDNIYGVDETVVPQLLLSPSVDEGFYLFLNPLPPGRHTIHWEAACANGAKQNDTYTITVRR